MREKLECKIQNAIISSCKSPKKFILLTLSFINMSFKIANTENQPVLDENSKLYSTLGKKKLL